MIIFGDRVFLRAVEESDNEMLLDLLNDPETEAMVGGKSFPVSESDQKKWFEQLGKSKDVLRCIVVEKERNQAVGTLILSDIDYINGVAQIHIKMGKKEGRNKGYGQDAIKTAVKYAFEELRLNCIYADILEYNIASIHLFEKCGFQKDGVLRSRVYKAGRYLNVFSYSQVKENSCERNR